LHITLVSAISWNWERFLSTKRYRTTRSEILSLARKVRPSGPRSARVIRLRRDTTRRGFPFSLGGWPSFVDGLRRSTETVARKRASATKRTPTTVTSYTTDFISLCYVTFLDETSDAGSLPFLSVSLSASLPISLDLSLMPHPSLHVSLSLLALATFPSHSIINSTLIWHDKVEKLKKKRRQFNFITKFYIYIFSSYIRY